MRVSIFFLFLFEFQEVFIQWPSSLQYAHWLVPSGPFPPPLGSSYSFRFSVLFLRQQWPDLMSLFLGHGKLNFLNIFYWLCYYSCPIFFSLLFPSSLPASHHIPPLSSCPWVIRISFLASPFPTLFLTFPCLFCTYYLCFLFPVQFPPFSSLPLLANNLPCDPHLCD